MTGSNRVDTQTAASHQCGCGSHDKDAMRTNASEGCCGGSAHAEHPTQVQSRPDASQQDVEGGSCCGGSHAETAPGSSAPEER